MSSSTSGLDVAIGRRARAVRIALMLLVAVALLEGVTRLVLMPASKDLSRYDTYAARARDLVAAPAPRVALIGNSISERGVQLDMLRHEWQAQTGTPLSVDMFIAYGSGVNTWYWMVAQDFWKQNIKPDLLILTYHGSRLTDSNPMDIGSIAQFFTDTGDRSALFEHDLTTLEHRVDYLLSSTSQTFATRDRIRERTLNLIPGYAAFTTASNAVNFNHEQRRESQGPKATYTYRAFHRFVERARLEGTQVCFVAFPMRPTEPDAVAYELESEVLDAISAAGMLHLDLRHMKGLSSAMYEDSFHLNAEGQPIYTRKLAEELAKVWPSRQSRSVAVGSSATGQAPVGILGNSLALPHREIVR